MKKKHFMIYITIIKFPAELAKIDSKKDNLYLKVKQFANIDRMEQMSFQRASQCIKIRGNNSGRVNSNDYLKQKERSTAI
jgi:hypothetical protein